MKNCPYCKKEFKPTNKRQKFCSDNCRKSSHQKKIGVIAHTVISPNVKPTNEQLQLMYPNVPERLLTRHHNIQVLKSCLINLSNDKDYSSPETVLSSIRSMIKLKERALEIRHELYKMDLFRKENNVKVFIQTYGENYTKLKEELDELIVDHAVRTRR